MALEQYRVFYQVAKSQSISKAAKQLYVSQPAVTKAIKTLEGELGLTLFVRNSKGVSLTDEGEVLLNYIRTAFESIEQGEKKLKQLKNKEQGSVTIGISNILCKHYFMPYLKLFHQRYPKLRIVVVNRTSPETLGLLERLRIDCAIVSHMDFHSSYHYHHLLSIQDTFVRNFPPPKQILQPADLEELPLLLLEKKNATRMVFDDYFSQHNIVVDPEIEISSMEFLVEFAKIGLGVAGVIRNFVRNELDNGSLYEWKVEPPLAPRSIGILYQKGEPLSIASKTFIDFMISQNVR